MSEFNIDSPYGVIIIQNMKAVHVDENYAALYGYDSAPELLKNVESFLDLIPEKYHLQAKQNYLDTIAGHLTPRGHTFVNVDRHGKEFTVFSVDHVVEWQGKPALQVTVIDLSAVVEANKKVREKDQMYKRLITQSGQGIMVHRDFKPLMLNKALARLLRADSVEQVSRIHSILDLVPEKDRDVVIQRYHNVMSGKMTGKSVVAENICFDGTRRFFNIYDNLIEWDGAPAVQVTLEDVTDKVQLERTLAYRASHDQLTDLYNRNAIYDWLEKQFDHQVHLTCLLMDIDDFKKVNDRYGHLTGDKVIRKLASVVKQTIKPLQGVAGRWGGEEFIAFIPNVGYAQVCDIAEDIRIAFHQTIFNSENVSFNASVSIGVSEVQGCQDLHTIEELIRATDKQLYLAKAHGKNQVSIEASRTQRQFQFL